MPATDFHKLFASFADIRVGVIGDVMLDTYWWGKVDRISPEAPVPVVAVAKREQRIGGAGNVALNITAVGASVSVITITGKDGDGNELIQLLNNNHIDTKYITRSSARPTTNKIRIIARNQHMMRLDAEVTAPLNDVEEEQLIGSFKQYLLAVQPHIVILEDYNKGVLTPQVIEKVIDLCKRNNVLTAVDPKRKNFFQYKGADIFKPNLQEAKEGLNIISDEVTDEMLHDIHKQLSEKLQHAVSFITLSEKGVFYEYEKDHRIIPTHIRSIADVSGAGDTVIAVSSVVYAATKDVRLMAEIANIAGGLVCEEVGTVAIDREKLLAECKALL
jgi:rfaE bifunctional protein kinase chain/domain